MKELDKLHECLRAFEALVNNHRTSSVHKHNNFNKRFSLLLTDWHYLSIIIERLDKTKDDNAAQLGLDLKSLYVFGRVFSESLLYLSSIFINTNEKREWNKIGPFIQSAKIGLEKDLKEFQNFWLSCGSSFELLCTNFRYRNFILHSKWSNTEWLMSWPGRSNLDCVHITNVPWREDMERKEERKSLCARDLVKILESNTGIILRYLENVIL